MCLLLGRSTLEKHCHCADGLAELEVQGDKDLKVRFYNIEDALDEKSWIAGIISETFGRKVGKFDPSSTPIHPALSLEALTLCDYSHSNLLASLLPASILIGLPHAISAVRFSS